jgi:hypothetical protein
VAAAARPRVETAMVRTMARNVGGGGCDGGGGHGCGEGSGGDGARGGEGFRQTRKVAGGAPPEGNAKKYESRKRGESRI